MAQFCFYFWPPNYGAQGGMRRVCVPGTERGPKKKRGAVFKAMTGNKRAGAVGLHYAYCCLLAPAGLIVSIHSVKIPQHLQ